MSIACHHTHYEGAGVGSLGRNGFLVAAIFSKKEVERLALVKGMKRFPDVSEFYFSIGLV